MVTFTFASAYAYLASRYFSATGSFAYARYAPQKASGFGAPSKFVGTLDTSDWVPLANGTMDFTAASRAFFCAFSHVVADDQTDALRAAANAAYVWNLCGDPLRAERELASLLREVPLYAAGYNDLAVLQWRRGARAEAIAALEHGLAIIEEFREKHGERIPVRHGHDELAIRAEAWKRS